MITIELTGVERLHANAARAIDKLEKLGRQAAEEVARETVEWMQAAILRRSLSLAPLSPAYAARKSTDAPILVLTHEYVESFMVRRVPEGFEIDLPTDDLRQRARWLELGTRSSPPRPHLRPAAAHARAVIGPRVGLAVLDQVAKELGK